METNRKALMKHFSALLRKRCNTETDSKENIDPTILKYLHRKDLIQIILQKHKNTLPVKLDLSVLENEELLPYIGDDLYLISYATTRWCEAINTASTQEDKPIETVAKSDTISKKQKKK